MKQTEPIKQDSLKPNELIDQWLVGLQISVRAHNEAAKHYERLHLVLSLPAVGISALLGTTVFASLQNSDSAWLKTTMGALSVATVVLSSLQASLRFAERSARHKAAAGELSEVRRALEEQLVFSHLDEPVFAVLRKKWGAATRQAPTIPSRIYDSESEKVRVSKEKQRDRILKARQPGGAPEINGTDEKPTKVAGDAPS